MKDRGVKGRGKKREREEHGWKGSEEKAREK